MTTNHTNLEAGLSAISMERKKHRVRETQEDRLLRFLENELSRTLWNPEHWITLPQIMSLGIASHSKIISNLRKAGHNIEIERQHKSDGQLFTRYRLVR